MSQPLRVLLVEDVEDDALLVLRMLRTGGFLPEHQRVDTPEAMAAALARGAWDIVISDYTMPRFTGLEALVLLKKSGLDVPFIVVTGTIGEEEAVGCMHAGAADYLLKDRLDRLPAAVQRALVAAEEHRKRLQAEQKLAASERRLRTIIETEPECVHLLGPNCMLLEMNPAGLRMIEADSLEQVIGQCMLNVILPEHRAAFTDMAERVLRGESGALEFEIQGMKGGRRWLETRAVPMRDEQGGVAALLGVTRDITGRKQAEEALRVSEERFRDLFEHSPDAIFVESQEGVVLDVNLAACQLHGLTHGQLVGRHVMDLVPPSEREWVARSFPKLTTGEFSKAEGFSWTADGRAVPVEITSSKIVFSGQPAVLLHVRDITERKRVGETLGRERTLLRTVIDLLPDHIYVKDTESRFLLANNSVAKVMGAASPEDLIGKSDKDFYPQEESGKFRGDEEEVLGGREIFNLEEPVTHPDGSQRFILTTKVPLKDAAGKIIGVVGIGRDFTERKRADESVRKSEAQLHTVIQSLSEGLLISTVDGQILHWNEAALQQHGFASEEEARLQVQEFRSIFSLATLDGLEIPFEQWPLPRIMRGEKLHGCELGIRRIGTDWERIFSYGGEIVHPASGPALAFLSMSDITERKRAERAVQTSQRMLQLILDNIPQGVFWKDRESRYLGCNAVVVQAFGIGNPESIVGMTDRDFGSLTPEQAEFFLQKDREVMASGQPQLGIIEQATMADGSTRWLETNKVPLFDMAGKVIGVLGTSQDITTRKQTEETLRMMRFSVDRAGDSVFWISREGRILYVNDAACAGRGYSREELLSLTIFDLNPDYDASVWEANFEDLKRRGTITLETRHRAKDGRVFPVEMNANYVFINGQEFNFASLRDITERQKQERLAQRSQRLEAIGTLAGGVAHDLNNAIAPIMMGLQLLKVEYPKESKIVDLFETSAQRGADMVRHLLAFAKGAEGERVSVPLHRLVRELENLMKGSFPKNIHLAIRCDPNLPPVRGDATQLHQVLLNLCVNARDAMPRGGKLTLEVKCVEVDATFASSIPDAKPGTCLALRVSDTGTGIPSEILDRIFDPFFTTKGPEKGTGLGLSTCMGIVKGHGGFLHVYSQPGRGSTFTAFLPVDPACSLAEPVIPAGDFRGQGETILFVDDDTAVRELGRAVLRHLNFTPVTATDGADGVIQAAQHRTELRAIITDLHMPHMDGLAFVREVRRLLPDIPIVVASGRMDDAEDSELKVLGVTNRLNKPFTQAQLAEALKNLLAPE